MAFASLSQNQEPSILPGAKRGSQQLGCTSATPTPHHSPPATFLHRRDPPPQALAREHSGQQCGSTRKFPVAMALQRDTNTAAWIKGTG